MVDSLDVTRQIIFIPLEASLKLVCSLEMNPPSLSYETIQSLEQWERDILASQIHGLSGYLLRANRHQDSFTTLCKNMKKKPSIKDSISMSRQAYFKIKRLKPQSSRRSLSTRQAKPEASRGNT